METAPLMPRAFLLLAGAEARAAENAAQATYLDPSIAPVMPILMGAPSLVRFQETIGRRWQAVEVVRSAYGWYVRLASGVDGFAIVARTAERGGSLDGSLAEAAAWARDWVAYAPDARYAFIRTHDLSEAEIRYLNEERLDG